MNPRRIALLGVARIVVSSGVAVTVTADGNAEIGVEGQLYPAGLIGAVSVRMPIADHHRIDLRVGFNRACRSDNGEHDDERGDGPGVGAESPTLSSCSRPRKSAGVFHSGNSSVGPSSPPWLWAPKSISATSAKMLVKARSYSAVLL